MRFVILATAGAVPFSNTTAYEANVEVEWRQRRAKFLRSKKPTFEMNDIGIKGAIGIQGATAEALKILSPRGGGRAVASLLLQRDLQEPNRTLGRQLAEVGFAIVPNWGLSPESLQKLREFREKRKTLRRRRLDPEFLKFLSEGLLPELALDYLGEGAVLAGITARSDDPRWHHDRCGRRLKAVVALSDGDIAEIAPGSHRTFYFTYTASQSRFRDPWIRANYDLLTLGARTGGGFVYDTNAIHKGLSGSGSITKLSSQQQRQRRRPPSDEDDDDLRMIRAIIIEMNDGPKSSALNSIAHNARTTFLRHNFPCPSTHQLLLGWPLDVEQRRFLRPSSPPPPP